MVGFEASIVDWSSLYTIGGIVSVVLLAYSLVTMILLIVIGGQPETATEGFTMLQENRFVGLLRMDILTLIIMPVYYLLFLSLYPALGETNRPYALIAVVLAFAGITLVLATPSALSFVSLSDKFVAAPTEAQRARLLAAGEAILASDLWHGTGATTGGALLQMGAVLTSAIMVQSPSFSSATAYVGLVTHGLDLAHILLGLLFPKLGVVLMAVAGPLYPVWFPLLAVDLFRLGAGF